MMPSPRSTMALVPLTGQSRKPSLRADISSASRVVSVGEIVLIWITVSPGRAPATMPPASSVASSTEASEGSRVQTASADRATAAADGAAAPPRAVRASTRAGRRSKPTTPCPALIRREATAWPSRPRPTMPMVVMTAPQPPRPPPRRPLPRGEREAGTLAPEGNRERRTLAPEGGEGRVRGKRSAVSAWRVVSRVDGVLEIVLRLVGPELRDSGERVDHRVLQLATHPLHLADIDALDRIAVRVEADGSARGVGEVHFPQRAEEAIHVLDVSADGLESRLKRHPRHVRTLGVIGWDLLVLRFVRFEELLVGGCLERGRVV